MSIMHSLFSRHAVLTGLFNPFTAPGWKKSGLKDAQAHLQTVYFLVL